MIGKIFSLLSRLSGISGWLGSFLKLGAIFGPLGGALTAFSGVLGPIGPILTGAVGLLTAAVKTIIQGIGGVLTNPATLSVVAIGAGIGFWQGVVWNKHALETVRSEYRSYQNEVSNANQEADSRLAKALAARKDAEERVASGLRARNAKQPDPVVLNAVAVPRSVKRRVRARAAQTDAGGGSWLQDFFPNP